MRSFTTTRGEEHGLGIARVNIQRVICEANNN